MQGARSHRLLDFQIRNIFHEIRVFILWFRGYDFYDWGPFSESKRTASIRFNSLLHMHLTLYCQPFRLLPTKTQNKQGSV